ncbi:efflux RND transporter permease subunit [Desulfosarcina sp. OttesenSCG-928-A07]|nr:efflux RND transporter permease subunit [Desulfosarcina sp. OttesenSCG-928-A07]
MARFFIDRPIFAWVIAILIMMAGAFSLATMPVAQYPNIAAPEVLIVGTYPGASAETIENTVTQVIEQQMKGIDNLIYMYSSSDSSGAILINFAFEVGTDIDIAQVQVQNKLQLAMPRLPEVVQRQGLEVIKSTKNFLMVLSLYSEDGSMEETDIGDYLATYIQDPLSRLPGVGETTLLGSQYAMRVWCDPAKFEQYKLNPSDIALAIQEQNDQVPSGKVGASPAIRGQEINITLKTASRLQTVEEFENIFLRINEDGSTLRLKDVARVELHNERYLVSSRFNGQPSAGFAIKLSPGENALEATKHIKAEMEKLSRFFPPGLKYDYSYDTAPVVEKSIEAVFHTLVEAIVLVFLVMFLFLQSFRATIIPTVAIPVVLLGTFAVMNFAGFTINTLTMFGMVLAIGLLVDDAIVVVENVERLMVEEKLSPKEAAKKSMDQVTGALVGVAMVICAVFVPMAFMSGSNGIIFRQFSITIVTAMTLSVFIALVLTPAMCATILPDRIHHATQGFFGKFNRWFEYVTVRYQRKVKRTLTRPRRYFAVFGVCLALVGVLFFRLPTGFLPDEDQGLMAVLVQMPAGSSMERTSEVLAKVDRYFMEEESDAVRTVMSASGFSFSGFGENTGLGLVMLKDWSDRKGEHLHASAVTRRAQQALSQIPDANIFVFIPPPVMELGSATGFDFELVDQASMGHEALMEARDTVLEKARKHPALTTVRHNGFDDVEEYQLQIDMAKAGAQSLRKGEITSAIAAYWGSHYVNDFTDKGRTKRVFLQAEKEYRMQAEDLNKYYVRNAKGDMVPFSSFTSMHSSYGSPRLERYGGVPSIEILGEPAPGYSSGQAMAAMEEIASELPGGFGYAWTGMSFQERLSGGQAPILYAVSIVVVFLCLAALYESWTVPLSVLLIVPFGVLGALAGVFLRDMSNDIYFQIGILTVIGLAAKNAILIVEFAKSLYAQGMDLLNATSQAARLRLRPIIMTSLCFILGVVPLMISSGAGAGGQNALGTTVVFGVSVATVMGLFYTPLFYVVVTKFFSRKKKDGSAPEALPQPEEREEIHA